MGIGIGIGIGFGVDIGVDFSFDNAAAKVFGCFCRSARVFFCSLLCACHALIPGRTFGLRVSVLGVAVSCLVACDPLSLHKFVVVVVAVWDCDSDSDGTEPVSAWRLATETPEGASERMFDHLVLATHSPGFVADQLRKLVDGDIARGVFSQVSTDWNLSRECQCECECECECKFECE